MANQDAPKYRVSWQTSSHPFLIVGLIIGVGMVIVHLYGHHYEGMPRPLYCGMIWAGGLFLVSLGFLSEPGEDRNPFLPSLWLSAVMGLATFAPFIMCELAGMKF